MIHAEIFRQADGKIVGFVLRGHNEIGNRGHGYNIHCAKVSVLSQSAFLAVINYLNRAVAAENHEHGGLGIRLKDAPDDLTEAVFQTMLTGLRAVENAAPDAIEIKLIETNAAAESDLQRKIANMKPSKPEVLPRLNVDECRIRAEIFRDGNENILGFSVRERKGKTVSEFEIYRAGVWSQVKAAFSCIKDFLKRDLEFKSGSRRLDMKLKTAPDNSTEAVFQTMLIGLLEIEKLAPQIVNVTEKIFLGGETK